MPLECGSRPETPKILVITLEFVNKNCFFADFIVKTHFFVVSPPNSWKFAHYLNWVFFSLHLKIRENPRIFRYEDLCFLVHNLGFEVLTLYIPGYFYTLFVPVGQIYPLSKNRLVSDRRKIFCLLKLFFVKFLKLNILRLWRHENDDDVIKTFYSIQICLNVAKYYFQFGLLLFQRRLW